jgi:hypothetical protein
MKAQQRISPRGWWRSTYTILGKRFKFAGRSEGNGEWYIFVDILRDGQWVNVTSCWMHGRTLPEISQQWALGYASMAQATL